MLANLKNSITKMRVETFLFALAFFIGGVVVNVKEGVSFTPLFFAYLGLLVLTTGLCKDLPSVVHMGFNWFMIALILFYGGVGLALLYGPDLVNFLFMGVGLATLTIGLLPGHSK